jgi:hypothetical protein
VYVCGLEGSKPVSENAKAGRVPSARAGALAVTSTVPPIWLRWA